MEKLREIVEKVHAKRKELELAVKQPLAKVTITSGFVDFGVELEKLLKEEINVKKVEWLKGEGTEVILDTNITEELEEEAKTRQLIRMIQNERKIKGINITQEIEVTNTWFPEDNNFTKLIKKTTSAKKLLDGDFYVREAN